MSLISFHVRLVTLHYNCWTPLIQTCFFQIFPCYNFQTHIHFPWIFPWFFSHLLFNWLFWTLHHFNWFRFSLAWNQPGLFMLYSWPSKQTHGVKPCWKIATSFPGSLILPPKASEKRPWLGLVTCYFHNWEHQGGVLCNQAVCRIELCRAATAIQPAMFNSSLRAKTSKSIYSDVYLKVRQVCLETIYRGLDVVAVVPFGGFMESRSYFNCARRAAQFYSEVIIINCCFSFECARSDWSKKKNIRTHSFLKVKLR